MRLALICYGGISLAVYMHGITKEIWRLARASQSHHAGEPPRDASEGIYARLIEAIAEEAGIELRILVDILTGASAGGINAIFLADAISTGHSLDPLTDLWLDTADVDVLLDPGISAVSRFAKAAAVPVAWALSSRRGGAVDQTVETGQRSEVRAKLANFVRARWFAPPFSGRHFTRLLLDSLEAMRGGERGPPLLPPYQPLDLFVTVTDFHGHPERLRLHSPAEVTETEHRLTLSFRDAGGAERRLADPAELAFAARATASFPGAFPPFRVTELDAALEERGHGWEGRDSFLERALPRQWAIGAAESAVLIDGSVLANAPFRPAIDALQNRPARREIDRRFVYIDPKPGIRSVRLSAPGEAEQEPGFFATIFGALSDIPREQPIRDNVDAIDGRSARIRRLRRIVDAMRPEVEAAIERAFGTTLLLGRPTPKRLAGWRTRAQNAAAREAGYAYAAYGHLKVAALTEQIAATLARASAESGSQHEAIRQAVWSAVRARGLTAEDAMTASGARPHVIDFFRSFDLAYRLRRARFVARRLAEMDQQEGSPREAIGEARALVYDLIGRYGALSSSVAGAGPMPDAAADAEEAMQALAQRLDLKRMDEEADNLFSDALNMLPRAERRAIVLSYLGYPFYDIATLPLLQGEGLDEFDPVKVDRISPDDATAIREGGAAATLKGIQFNSFGAFFSRAYRENDYLWGRLHGADRLIDIVVSTLPEGTHMPAGAVANLKRDAFRAILAEERPRLTQILALFDELEREVG